MMKTSFALFLPFLFFTSCATITRGVHDKLTVLSDPTGADVRLSSGEKGVTPAKFVKSRRGDKFTVTISKPGYSPQTVQVESRYSGTGGTAMAGNIIAGGLIGVGVDAASGAYNSLYPNPISVRLVPRPKSAPAKREKTPKKQKAAAKLKASPGTKNENDTQEMVITPASQPVPAPSASPTPQ
ncbi:MAG: PEGA domain-containing protein [Verrucomicrobiota bacterium]